MCGRYYTDVDREEMQNIINAVNRAMADKPELSEMKTGEVYGFQQLPNAPSDHFDRTAYHNTSTPTINLPAAHSVIFSIFYPFVLIQSSQKILYMLK